MGFFIDNLGPVASIKAFYAQHKPLFEVIAAVAAISALFLQIDNTHSEPLKMVQALLLLILSTLIIVFLFLFLVFLNRHSNNSWGKAIPIEVLFSGLSSSFVINLLSYLYQTFNKELFVYLNLLRFSLLIITISSSRELSIYLINKFGHWKLWLALYDLVFVLSFSTFWFWQADGTFSFEKNRIFGLVWYFIVIYTVVYLKDKKFISGLAYYILFFGLSSLVILFNIQIAHYLEVVFYHLVPFR